ncbi:putative transcriptional regulator [Acidovorax sp. CF316]|uniref:MmyB family transcriptional regulator n=1 Tax=Acidovorax sp. CF316 TaxID=1144317 RepID=UPI00026BD39E|nr:helix-turn-helix domain-containing protein [Acidovorax sp. CF316]EJE52202.1 putative transcriptional regulator [Acidovorax sp. CF316]
MHSPRTDARSAPPKAAPVGLLLKALRERQRLSQMALALHTGVSQRHLSCLETGKAQPSRAMLLALLDALRTPLAERNRALLAAGFAPHYPCRDWQDEHLAPVRDTLREFLRAHEPAPAMLLDAQWNVLETNAATPALMRLIGFTPAVRPGAATMNMLELLLGPDGLLPWIVNAADMASAVLQRAQAEAALNPALAERLQTMPMARMTLPIPTGQVHEPPVLLMQLRSSAGVLRFMSAFTTLASPLDVTLESLRMDHLLPADADTRRALENALAATAPPT